MVIISMQARWGYLIPDLDEEKIMSVDPFDLFIPGAVPSLAPSSLPSDFPSSVPSEILKFSIIAEKCRVTVYIAFRRPAFGKGFRISMSK